MLSETYDFSEGFKQDYKSKPVTWVAKDESWV